MANVIEVFGQFATQVNGKVKMFATKGEAESAAVMEEQAGDFQKRAEAYCVSRELDPESKMAKAKINVIVDFLAFEATGAPAETEPEAAPETPAAESTTDF